MKVWEKCNEVKGTDVSIEVIANWTYINRVCPLTFDIHLELDIPLDDDGYPVDNGFLLTAYSVCNGKCGYDCLMNYLNSEFDEEAET